ncbi:MAG: PqqD family protein [Myxococcales bacterium]|nr:PqqD family protein [Myxococcales bacterium]
MTTLHVAPGLTIRQLPDGEAVVARDQGAEATIVNATALAVLELFGAPSTEEEVARIFSETFPHEDVAQIREDIAVIVRQLRQSGILEECGSASSTA